jgi:hypothetical protein
MVRKANTNRWLDIDVDGGIVLKPIAVKVMCFERNSTDRDEVQRLF